MAYSHKLNNNTETTRRARRTQCVLCGRIYNAVLLGISSLGAVWSNNNNKNKNALSSPAVLVRICTTAWLITNAFHSDACSHQPDTMKQQQQQQQQQEVLTLLLCENLLCKACSGSTLRIFRQKRTICGQTIFYNTRYAVKYHQSGGFLTVW